MRCSLPFVLLFVCSAPAAPALAQTSASYRLTESVLQNGGHPLEGQILQAPSVRVSLDAVGDSVPLLALASASYSMDAGFAIRYRPPGEVRGMAAPDKLFFSWQPESSAGTYAVYRGLIQSLPGSYGTCKASNLTSPTLFDPDRPNRALGELGFQYLVTVRNLLREEGTTGSTSSGAPRPNPAPCP